MKTVLVVDDDEEVRTFLVETLRRYLGAEVLWAADGKAAITTLRAFRVDLVVTDYSMTPVNGLELVQSIRGDLNSSVPVILMSGNKDVGERARVAGANAFFSKPFNIVEVLEKAKRLMS